MSYLALQRSAYGKYFMILPFVPSDKKFWFFDYYSTFP